MKVVYHSADLDGRCSGAIVKYKYPECGMIPYDYGRQFPWDKIERDEEVIMIDVSLDIDDMIKLDERSHLTWIDHHKSAMDEADAKKFNPEGVRTIGKAACELAWEYLFPDDPVPEVVYLLGRYDVWDHHDKPRVMPFQYGMKLKNTSPGSSIWSRLFPIAEGRNHHEIREIIEDGRKIIQYVKNDNKSYARGYAFESDFQGYKAIAINRGIASRHLFDSVWDPKKYHLMLAFCMRRSETDHRWRVTLYSDREDVDVSEIARKFGGGGHKGAAGFECDRLPFPWRKKDDIAKIHLNDTQSDIIP